MPGNDDAENRSRDASFAPELCHGTARKRWPPKIRGGGAPNDAGVEIRPGSLRERAQFVFQSGARHGWFRVTTKHPPRGALAFRRSAATFFSFGLRLPESATARAATTPFTSELLAPRSLCRRGRVRSRPGAGYEPRAQAPHPTPLQGSSRESVPSERIIRLSGMVVLYLNRRLLSTVTSLLLTRGSAQRIGRI